MVGLLLAVAIGAGIYALLLFVTAFVEEISYIAWLNNIRR